MSVKTATISVTGRSGPGTRVAYVHGQERGIVVDTPGWFGWLEEAATTSFSYPVFDPGLGAIVRFLTVRKERRQRGGAYWSAYWRAGQRVRRAYLGKSALVTQARLEALAEMVREHLHHEGAAEVRW